MKKILSIFFMAAALVACQKEDENGDLGAFWKILEIKDHATEETINLKEKNRFWGIQLDLLEIRKTELNVIYCRFQHIDDSLMVQTIGDKDVDLKEWGIYKNDNERYKILLLNDKSMILNSKYAQIIFRKF